VIACELPVLARATDWSTQDYDLYPGDFNGDGKTDVLYVAKSPSMPSGIALSDGERWTIGFQSWSSSQFGIPWYSNVYKPIIGDFNGDGYDDVLLQRQTPGDSYLLFANSNPSTGPVGQLLGISQTIPTSYGGLGWTADQHQIIVGKFDSQSGADVFLQANTASGTHGIFSGSASGFAASYTAVPDTTGGFSLNAHSATLYAGNFNGDAYDDLLVQAKANIVLIDYDVPIPVPVFKPQSFGVIYLPLSSSIYQFWNRQQSGVDWSPANSNIIVGDFDGDGRDDVLVQSKRPGGAVYVIRGSGSGSQLLVDSAGTVTFSGLSSASGDTYRVLAGDFAGHGSQPLNGLYFQSTSSSGTNYIAQSIPMSSGSSSVVAQSTNPAEVISYSYDARGRLIRVGRVGTINNNVTTQYTYDKANNRKTVVTTGSSNTPPP
jgi:hypothetical protein